MMAAPERWRHGRPARTGYIYSADVDADSKRAAKMGGAIRRSLGYSRCRPFPVIADPHGAMFNLFKPDSGQSPAPVPEDTPGHIGWRELHAGDGKTAWNFYSGMFGWTKAQSFDMGALGVYQLFATGGAAVGGMMTKTADTPEAHWLYYFNVDAIDAAAARAIKGGGKVLMGPHQVPTGQWIVQCTDPQGAMFAMVAPKR
jgi:predicted enzyme related to lactoylglutathione lyase